MSKVQQALVALREIQACQLDRDEIPESQETQDVIDILEADES